MLIYDDQRLGFVDTVTDRAYVMDDYGNLVRVPFIIGHWYWSEE